MVMRLRILVGTAALVLGLAAYGLVIAALAARLMPPSPVLAFVIYALAGIAWVGPAARLTRWMQRSGGTNPS
jgi:hypothetical protein